MGCVPINKQRRVQKLHTSSLMVVLISKLDMFNISVDSQIKGEFSYWGNVFNTIHEPNRFPSTRVT
jgi:hypothetical protein